MTIDDFIRSAQREPGLPPAWRGSVDAAHWLALADAVQQAGGRLVSLWGSERHAARVASLCISAAYATREGLICAELPLPDGAGGYPALDARFPAAQRMQRATFDLLGVAPTDAADTRPWLQHGAWPSDYFPLRSDGIATAEAISDYAFVPVSGDGVHEIAVGPVHAGIIEPGHFRFSVVGEKVLRLEERLGYTHKGIEQRFVGMNLAAGLPLAGRVSGDSTLAFALAYCQAAESLAAIAVPRRALWLRALLLERERIANHLGDLGALGNDAAFAFGLTHFMRLKEDWVRLNGQLFGHRFLMDRIVPGGVAVDLDAAGSRLIADQCVAVDAAVRALQGIYEAHAGLQDRFITTGTVKPPLAAQLGLTGLAGRASSMAFDLRNDYPLEPWSQLGFRMATHRNGDVAARVIVRFDEIFESLRLIRAMLAGLPAGPLLAPDTATTLANPALAGAGIGWVEGWRGEVLVAMEVHAGKLTRVHCHDPSWHNWPVLEHAVIGNIVPDFPLINKSFNLSYSGHDR